MVSVLLKISLVCIVCEVLSEHIYLLTPTYIVIIVNFIGKFKY